ncbi:hypothetical protein GCM10010255_62230 [Streptomyces coeruleofuscus]|uniref:Uncharacterized protein n=1 Tax=Streptomyces coeruleofuscus TaxID=66879 RepID=A0ABN3IY37_9ACTN
MVAGPLGCQVAALAADDGGDFEFEVQDRGAGRHGHVVVRADDGVRIGEVEGRRVVPGIGDPGRVVDAASYALDVFLEGDEVPYGRRLERRQQPHLRDMRAARRVRCGVARLAQGCGARPEQV